MDEKNRDSRKEEIAEVAKEMIGWEDNKLFNTLKDLTLRPGEMARVYCNGKTNTYISPMAYFLGVTGLMAYLGSASGLNDAIIESSLKSLDASSGSNTSKDIGLVKEKLGTILSFLLGEVGQKLILVPPLLLLTWSFYQKFTPSFKENSWVSLYVLAHTSLLSLPFMGIWFLTKELGYYTLVTTSLWYLLWVWTSKGFYNIKWGKAITWGTLLFIFYNVIYVMVVGLISVVLIW